MGHEIINKYPPLGPDQIKTYLSQRGYEFKEIAGDNLKLKKCPACGHKDSFSINHSSGQWQCWFSECAKRGNWVTLRRLLNDAIGYDKSIVSFRTEWREFFADKKYTPVTVGKYPKLLEYLHNRGFSDKTLDAFNVTSNGPECVRFPMYAWHEGKWEIQNARVIKVLGDKKNWFGITGGPTHLLMGNHLQGYRPEKTVYIFEGQWDMLTAYELGMRNVFSLPNGASSVKKEMLQYIPDDWDICIAVDMDPSGDVCAKKFFDIFRTRVSRIHMPKKDLNDWYMEQRDLTLKDVLSRRSSNIEQRKNTYRKLLRNMTPEQKEQPIVSTPFKGLTKLMGGGFFPSQMTSILAASGAGKTTFVNQIAVYVAHQGVKVGLISLEGSELDLNQKIDRTITGFVGEDGNDKTILENLFISVLKGKYVTHEEIINVCNSMAKDDGCKVIIVDNLDYISSGTDPQKYATTAALMSISEEEKIHLIQLWQCKKYDPTQRVNSGQQKGESRIFQDSHNYINLNNKVPDGKELEMEKNRNEGLGAFKVYLDYDYETNSYIEVKQEIKKANVFNMIMPLET